MKKLTPHQIEKFIDGFCAGAPKGYVCDCDLKSDTPWCAPWTWQSQKEWYLPGVLPYQMGRLWARRCAKQIEMEIAMAQFDC